MKETTLKTPYKLFNIECEKGWMGLIQPIISAIDKHNKDDTCENKCEILQIKEKFGFLCFYTNSAPKHIIQMIRKAEENSRFICEICGSPINV